MPSPENVRIAVLIDADNTSPKHAEALLEEVAKYGVPTVKRAYGDWTNSHLNSWRSELPKHAVQPMLQIANTTGKNSTDSALIIDAMDLLYSGNVDAFALVSSDSDFTSLAIRLRGSGRTVYGMGLRKTPQSLRQAVDRFIFLEDLHDAGGADESAAEDTEARRIPDLRRLLERAVNGTSHDDGWASLSSIANHITRVEPSFSVKDYGAGKLVDLVRAQDYLEVEQPEGGSVRVRLRANRSTRRSGRGSARGSGRTRTRGGARTGSDQAAVQPTEPTEQPALIDPVGAEPAQPTLVDPPSEPTALGEATGAAPAEEPPQLSDAAEPPAEAAELPVEDAAVAPTAAKRTATKKATTKRAATKATAAKTATKKATTKKSASTTAADEPAAEEPAAAKTAAAKRTAAKKTATKKTATKKTATKKTAAKRSASETAGPDEPAAEPAAEPARHTVTTRTRSQRKAQSG